MSMLEHSVVILARDVKPGGAVVGGAGGVSSPRGIPCGLRGRWGTGPRPPPTPARLPRTGLSRSIAASPAVHAAPDTRPPVRPPSGGTGGHFREVHHDVADPRLHEARQVLAHAAEELHAYLPADHDQCMIVSQLTQRDRRPGRSHVDHIDRECGRRSGSTRLREAVSSVGIGGVRHRTDPFSAAYPWPSGARDARTLIFAKNGVRLVRARMGSRCPQRRTTRRPCHLQ